MSQTLENTQSAISFVESIELPDQLESINEGPTDIVPPNFTRKLEQTVTIGSQLAGFAAGISSELRPQVSNAFLLAQLAANRHIKDHHGSSRDWYRKYIEVMSNIGWVVEGDADSFQEVTGTTLQVHKQIIPILTAALGPNIAAATTIINILNGLKEMSTDQPWITLFQQESQRASANQFQISFASNDGGVPRITLACFELDASNSITQVLFFKFQNSHAKLRHFDVKLSINEQAFGHVSEIISQRVNSYLASYISAVEI